MRIKSTLSVIFAGVLITIACINLVQAAGYTITDLGTLGGTDSFGEGVNENGHVAGWSDITGDGARHAFRYDGNTLLDLGTLGGDDSSGADINAHGHVTGWSDISGDNARHAFVYNGATLQDLGTLGGTYSFGEGINDSGHVAGMSYIAGDTGDHAFLYDGNSMLDLGTLGGTDSRASDINNSDHVTGWSQITGDTARHAFLYDGNTLLDLGTLGGTDSWAYGLNDNGHVTGWSEITGDTARHAFVYNGTTLQDLGTLGGPDSVGYGINNFGHVVGNSDLDMITSVAFLYDGNAMLNLCVLTDCGNNGWAGLDNAYSINDGGDITGYGDINGETHAFLISWIDQPIPEICTDGIDNDEDGLTDCEDDYDCGQAQLCYTPPGMFYDLIDLGTLGGTYSYATRLNEVGQVTGVSRISDGTADHAFLHDGNIMHDLGVLEVTHTGSTGNGINDSGQVAGTSSILSYYPVYRAFLYDGSTMLDLHALMPSPCDLHSRAYDINNNGHVTGTCTVEVGDPFGGYGHSFIYDGSTVQDIGTLGGESSYAYGINDSGHVTGRSQYTLLTNSAHAFVYDGHRMHDLGTLGGSSSSGRDINDFDQVTGWSYIPVAPLTPALSRAFFHDGSTMHDLGTLGGDNSFGNGINNSAQVVGTSRLASGGSAAFLYHDNRMLYLCTVTDCNAKGWTDLTRATDINDNGDITGYGVINGDTHAFLALAMSGVDTDGDGVDDSVDNCVTTHNPDQADLDSDGIGDACEAPEAHGFWPGTASAGELVHIFGLYFDDSQSQVSFNGLPATGLFIVDSTHIVAIVPAGDVAGPITVTTPFGTDSTPTDFAVSSADVTIDGFWPSSGLPGAFIHVFGDNFDMSSTQVDFNGTPAAGLFVVDPTHMVVITPLAGASTGPITVTTPAGSATSSDDFIVLN